MSTISCPNCGNQVNPDAIGCQNCGANLQTGVVPKPQAVRQRREAAGAGKALAPVRLSSIVVLGVLALVSLAAFILTSLAIHDPLGFMGRLQGSTLADTPDAAWSWLLNRRDLGLLAIVSCAGIAVAFVLQLLAYKTKAAARVRASRPSSAAFIALTLVAVFAAMVAIGAWVTAQHNINFFNFFLGYAYPYQVPIGAFVLQYAAAALLSVVVVAWVMLVLVRQLRFGNTTRGEDEDAELARRARRQMMDDDAGSQS